MRSMIPNMRAGHRVCSDARDIPRLPWRHIPRWKVIQNKGIQVLSTVFQVLEGERALIHNQSLDFGDTAMERTATLWEMLSTFRFIRILVLVVSEYVLGSTTAQRYLDMGILQHELVQKASAEKQRLEDGKLRPRS